MKKFLIFTDFLGELVAKELLYLLRSIFRWHWKSFGFKLTPSEMTLPASNSAERRLW